ncbi:cyclase family protein [Dasania marina]|uniref:cyclase family protein n=1 Tax=Dasania marina TaxID=471499 RepID=UPI0030D879F1|tara:strand:- start:1149 stop:1829 length:681 start_codon:yes stop_codon:yes gene_type:complete
MLKIVKIVDLSLPLNIDTPIYPGDPKPDVTVATTIEHEGYNLFNLHLGTQTGSHIDAPYHFNNQGATVDAVELKQCFGNGLVIDVSHKQANEAIVLADVVGFAEQLSRCDIVLLKTGWDSTRGTEAFFTHPYLSLEAADYILSKDVKTIAIDTINLDKTGGTQFPVHQRFAEVGGIIAENLAGFAAIDFEHPLISVLPLNLTACDGSPVRAVAIQAQWSADNTYSA